MAPRKNDHLLALIADAPWWIGVSLAAGSYVIFRYVLPAVISGPPVLKVLTGGLAQAAWIIAAAFLGASIVSLVRAAYRRRLLDRQADLDSVRALSWQEFELLVSEAFRRQGFAVEERGGSASDGGVDLALRKAGRSAVVQCKRWKTKQVGVSLVRELYGVMTAERADEAIFVASGDYTSDARAFADGKPIHLIDGATLLFMIREVQSSPKAGQLPGDAQPESHAVAPFCPKCGKLMVRRIAKTGFLAGQPFWGCSAFPSCRGIRSIS